MSQSMWLAHNQDDELLDLFSGNRPVLIEGYWTGEPIPGCAWISRFPPGYVGIEVNPGECRKVRMVLDEPLDALELDMKADPQGASTIVSRERLAELTQANT